MKRLLITCDKCGAEIEGKPARVSFYDTDRESEDVGQALYEPNQDYCDDCVAEMIALIDNFKPKKEETKVEKEEQKKPRKRKTDVGKIWALHDAGWKMKDIALDAEVAISTVHRVLKQPRPVPEYEKEKAADLE